MSEFEDCKQCAKPVSKGEKSCQRESEFESLIHSFRNESGNIRLVSLEIRNKVELFKTGAPEEVINKYCESDAPGVLQSLYNILQDMSNTYIILQDTNAKLRELVG